MDDLLTPRELARKLNVPITWIYDRTREGGPERIPHYKLGRYLRFAESEVVDFLRIRAADGGAESQVPAHYAID